MKTLKKSRKEINLIKGKIRHKKPKVSTNIFTSQENT